MSRTTLAIDDDLLKRLKERASSEGGTFQQVVNDLLRQALAEPQPKVSYHLSLRGWEAVEQPGVALLDRDKLFDDMDGR